MGHRSRTLNIAPNDITVKHERHGVLNRQQISSLFNRFFKLIAKNTSQLRISDSLWREPPVNGGFPSQRASNASTVSTDRRLNIYCDPTNYVHGQELWMFYYTSGASEIRLRGISFSRTKTTSRDSSCATKGQHRTTTQCGVGICMCTSDVNSLWHSNTIWRHSISVMSGAEPSPEPMLP